MLYEQNIALLKALGLDGMAMEYQSQHTDVTTRNLSFDERCAPLLEAERHSRAQRKFERLQNNAKLRSPNALLESVDCTINRGLTKEMIAEIKTNQWISVCHNLIFTGPSGTGKTYCSCAAANHALREGFSAQYWRFPRLLEKLEASRIDGSIIKFRDRLAKIRILVLDDWAICPMNAKTRSELFEVIEDKYERGSLIINSLLPIDQWYDYIKDQQVAESILDRLIPRSYQYALHGEGLRKRFGGVPTKGDKS